MSERRSGEIVLRSGKGFLPIREQTLYVKQGLLGPLVVLWLADMEVKLFTTEVGEVFSACAAEKVEISPAFPARKGLKS